ncbi:MAG: hypothetical protein HOF95_04730 [Rhodospirillales bacterium]|jgi:hypothetical protein|nr:hypothetical protein [Rhodospirillales bacterium]MBT4007237.1 hypothetical protein [Rhodospirillales bacterium]MBT5076851.1 hypothetical protein [Rhodospirillales bacterium]MBT5113570.1 hypothetical protein [Rhodospirillales bacterium]MBT5673868.1 hypothetical protein [Rhodospirillales bacterium]
MSHTPPTLDDIRESYTATAMPPAKETESTTIRNRFQAYANMNKVFAIKPGDRVAFLTDPRLDRRVVDAISGIARANGAECREFMWPSTRITEIPEVVRPLLEQSDFVVSSWFASTGCPFANKMRKETGQRWVKITYFRNLDVLETPHARFPVELVGEIIRATARLYPRDVNFDMQFTDDRGSDLTIEFTPKMTETLLGISRWRGLNTATEPGCYIHYLPTHGPNLYGQTAHARDPKAFAKMNGVIFPQWAVGFPKPFDEKIGVEFKDDFVSKVHGKSLQAEQMREYLIGGRLQELGCGHNPKAPRYGIYPAGPNSPGGLHFGINALKESAYLRRAIPHWEEPHIHMDLVTFDTTVKAGNTTILDKGFLMSLRDEQVIAAAEKFGDPVELLESYDE